MEINRIRSSETFPYRLTILTNKDDESKEVAAFTKEPDSKDVQVKSLGMYWPDQVYSLSHVAIPFPPKDPIYGEKGRIQQSEVPTIGSWHPRGEKGVLQISAAQFLRIRYNPFFHYIEKTIDAELAPY